MARILGLLLLVGLSCTGYPSGIGTDEEALLSGVGTIEASVLADELPGALLERELPAGKK